MKKIILMMILFLLSFSYGFGDVFAKAGSIYFDREIINGKTQIANFTIRKLEISPEWDLQSENSYFIFDDIIVDKVPYIGDTISGEVGFLKLKVLNFNSSQNKLEGRKAYFSNNNGEKLKNIVLENVSGECQFVWKNYENSGFKDGYYLKMGKIIKRREEISSRPVLLKLNGLKQLQPLNVEVKEHMSLGKGMAGEIFNTNGGTTKGTPAKISLTGSSNEKVKITIPKTTEIKNGKNSLTVNLNFREEGANGTNSNEWELKRLFLYNGEIKNITIDGSMKTTKETSTGKYNGTFKVRAEYID